MLALKGANKRVDNEIMGRRFLAWHMVRPHAGKKFPSLQEFMGVSAKAKAKPALDTNTVMRRWVSVMAAAEAQAKTKTPRKT